MALPSLSVSLASTSLILHITSEVCVYMELCMCVYVCVYVCRYVYPCLLSHAASQDYDTYATAAEGNTGSQEFPDSTHPKPTTTTTRQPRLKRSRTIQGGKSRTLTVSSLVEASASVSCQNAERVPELRGSVLPSRGENKGEHSRYPALHRVRAIVQMLSAF